MAGLNFTAIIKEIGTSSGNNLRNLPYGNGRWQATDRVQTAKEYSEEKVGQVRRMLPTKVLTLLSTDVVYDRLRGQAKWFGVIQMTTAVIVRILC